MTTTAHWKQRPAGANWGDFGPDDQLGRLNWVGAQARVRAAREIQQGLSFSLSLPLDVPRQPVLNPRRAGPVIRPSMKNGMPIFNFPLGNDTPGATDVVSDDVVTMSPQYSTQWDALGHVCSCFDAQGSGTAAPVGYNGFRVVGHQHAVTDNFNGAAALSIDPMAQHGIQGRGVLIDLRHHFGDQARLVSFADVEAVMKADRIELHKGDIVCFHTGLADIALNLNAEDDHEILKTSCCALDGNDPKLLEWITQSQVSALAADNHAVEKRNYTLKAGQGPLLPLHEHCLVKLGMPLGELWHLSILAKWLRENERHAFFLTAPPIYLRGMVGAPVNPVATV